MQLRMYRYEGAMSISLDVWIEKYLKEWTGNDQEVMKKIITSMLDGEYREWINCDNIMIITGKNYFPEFCGPQLTGKYCQLIWEDEEGGVNEDFEKWVLGIQQ